MNNILFLTITIISLLVSSERVISGPIGIRMDETIRLGSAFGLTIDMDTAFAQKNSLGQIFRQRFRLFKDLTPQNLSDYSRQYPTEFWPLNNYLHNLYRNGLITAENLTTYRAASVRGLKYYLDAYQRTLPPIVEQSTFDASIDLLESSGIEPIEDLDSRKHAFQFERPEESLAPVTAQIPLRVIEPINDLDNHKHIFQFDKPEEPPAPVPSQTPELDRFLEIAKDVASGKTIEDSVETRAREAADHFISAKVRSYLSERFKTARLNGRLFSGDGDSEVSFGLVTSLSDTDTSTLFNQLDVTARNDATIASVGFGYRSQLDRSSFVGVNGFLDHDIPNDHTRASIGLEWKDTYVSLTANQYVPLSDYQTITKHESQRPAEGFDVDLAVTTPEWPLSVTYRTALWDLGDRGQNRIKAYGLTGDITDELNLQVENIESSQTSPSIMSKLTYTYRFDRKNASVLPDPSLFESTRYQFVVRDQTMPMATKIANQAPVASNKTYSITEDTSLTIDLSTLISDPDGDALTVSLTNQADYVSLVGTNVTVDLTDAYFSTDTITVNYETADPSGATNQGTLTLAVIHRPDPVGACAGSAMPDYVNEGIVLTADDRSNVSTQSYWSGNGHVYEFVVATEKWAAASTIARSRSLNGVPGHLVTITSQAEQDFIESEINSKYGARAWWIAASDSSVEGCWQWVDGPESGQLLTATYQNWIVGEPNDDGIGEDAAAIAASGMWNDGKEGLSTISYIIEYSGVSP